MAMSAQKDRKEVPGMAHTMLDCPADASVVSPSIVPDEPLDRAHLFRMTLGDHSLEGEVLRLFDRQCGMLLERMVSAQPACIKALAHTLDGSARGIGAWRVSRAARDLQITVDGGGNVETAVAALRTAVDETLVVVAEVLRVH